jgi:hypothetical protein
MQLPARTSARLARLPLPQQAATGRVPLYSFCEGLGQGISPQAIKFPAHSSQRVQNRECANELEERCIFASNQAMALNGFSNCGQEVSAERRLYGWAPEEPQPATFGGRVPGSRVIAANWGTAPGTGG